jgi:hypothetical protein
LDISAANHLNPADSARAFRQGLKDSGYVEGENVTIEYRVADNQMDRLRRWRPTWFADASPSLSPSVVPSRRWRPNQPAMDRGVPGRATQSNLHGRALLADAGRHAFVDTVLT